MEHSGYKETYFQFISEKNLDQIKIILKNHDYHDPDTIDAIEIREREGVPYLYLFVETSDYIGYGHYGMIDGVYIYIESLIPWWTERFYLPVLIIRKIINKNLEQFIDVPKLHDHEFYHIKEIINFINENPSYIHESLHYGAENCMAKDLARSIEFEINKLFSC